MTQVVLYLRSSVGRKLVMGLTGLGLCGFVLTHMAGNLFLLVGPEAYNNYAYQLTHNKEFLLLAETGLTVLFVVHILCGVTLNMENRAARAQGYAMTPNGDKEPCPASQMMLGTGALLLFFLVFHLAHFRFGVHYPTVQGGMEIRDLYRLARESFERLDYLGVYLVALAVLAVHLRHGAWSAFQSLGLTGPRFRPLAQAAALAYGLVVLAGFAAPPLFIFFSKFAAGLPER